MLKNPVYFYEDINSTDVEESLVGRKGLSLFLLKDYDVPVPPFFCNLSRFVQKQHI